MNFVMSAKRKVTTLSKGMRCYCGSSLSALFVVMRGSVTCRYGSSNILIPSLLKVGARKTCALMKMSAGLRDSGCVCAGGRGPSGASSSSLAAHRRSSSPSAAAASRPQSTGAPRHFLVSPARCGRKKSWEEERKVQQTAKKVKVKKKKQLT